MNLFGNGGRRLALLFVHLLLLISPTFGASVEKPCRISVGPHNNVRIKLPGSSELDISSFEHSSDNSEAVHVPSGTQVEFACIDEDDVFRHHELSEVQLLCKEGELVYQDENRAELGDLPLECVPRNRPSNAHKPASSKHKFGDLVRNGTCESFSQSQQAINIDVHVTDPETEESSILYSVCFVEATSTTLYSHSFIDGLSLSKNLQESGKRPSTFQDQGFFPFNVDLAYKRKQETTTLTNLLGSDKFHEYVPNPQYFLSRGHLHPNADPIKNYQKDGTFFFVNVVPQWQILNAGNWVQVENSFRNLAKGLKSEVKVWTGTFGVVELKDENDTDVELWMGLPSSGDKTIVGSAVVISNVKRLPVPKFMWKVAYNKEEDAAIALVQINNPWAAVGGKDILCTDICDQVDWLTLSAAGRKNVKKGFTYCCDVNELRKQISTVPDLKYSKILLNHGESTKDDLDETAEFGFGEADGNEENDPDWNPIEYIFGGGQDEELGH